MLIFLLAVQGPTRRGGADCVACFGGWEGAPRLPEL